MTTPDKLNSFRRGRLDSQSRINRINELYEKKKNQHQKKPSNTSVNHILSTERKKSDAGQDNDECVPIEITSSKQTEVKTYPVNRKGDNDDTDSENDEEDVSIEELTPKLKSRRSIESMRKQTKVRRTFADGDYPDSNLRIPNNTLKQLLGDPVPLPYIQNSRTHHESEGILGLQIKRDLETKWNNRFAQKANAINDSLNTSTLSKLNSPIQQDRVSFDQLLQGINSTTEKLDLIIKLLDKKKESEVQQKDIELISDNRKILTYLFWVSCIITIVACNIYIIVYL